MHDVTALRTDGIEGLLRRHLDVQAEVDAGYQGLARDFPAQVSGPPEKPRKDAPPEETARWEQQRHQQSSQRICIEHAIAEPKQWRSMQRWIGRREYSKTPLWPSPGSSPTAPPRGKSHISQLLRPARADPNRAPTRKRRTRRRTAARLM
jgi:hypothetical protein